jgi:hypothetical protein
MTLFVNHHAKLAPWPRKKRDDLPKTKNSLTEKKNQKAKEPVQSTWLLIRRWSAMNTATAQASR